MPDNDISGIECILKRRDAGEPLQYILGEAEFFGRAFMVTPSVLIPRHDTECVVCAAVEHIDASGGAEKLSVLDIGTGSGAIGVTIAMERPERVDVTAVDVSEAALAVAKMNAEALGARVEFMVSDLLDAFRGGGTKFDIIISNPPYIRENEYDGLAREVKFEPVAALVAKDSGLEFYKRIIDAAQGFLRPGGVVIFETGHDMAPDIEKYAAGAGFTNSSVYRDIEKRSRGLKLWA
jgi:release factor glutamine methyltransferase